MREWLRGGVQPCHHRLGSRFESRLALVAFITEISSQEFRFFVFQNFLPKKGILMIQDIAPHKYYVDYPRLLFRTIRILF